MRSIGIAAAALCALIVRAAPARAQDVTTEEVEYRQGDTVLQGFLAYDASAKKKRPGVLVIHEWWGHNAHARNQALRLAQAGYVGFALDMYGKGKVATHPEDAQAFAKEATADPAVTRARFEAALDLLRKRPEVDPKRIAAIGYCFGGGVALAMARAGEDLKAVATFHGALANRGPAAEKGKVKARILVQTGGDDPMVPKEQVEALRREMKAAGARVEVITYPGVKHGFTNPEAGKAGMAGLAYDADADRKSWAAMLAFFKKALG
jgi:dienelactone hydrolase